MPRVGTPRVEGDVPTPGAWIPPESGSRVSAPSFGAEAANLGVARDFTQEGNAATGELARAGANEVSGLGHVGSELISAQNHIWNEVQQHQAAVDRMDKAIQAGQNKAQVSALSVPLSYQLDDAVVKARQSDPNNPANQVKNF